MLPRKFFENSRTIMAILVHFEPGPRTAQNTATPVQVFRRLILQVLFRLKLKIGLL